MFNWSHLTTYLKYIWYRYIYMIYMTSFCRVPLHKPRACASARFPFSRASRNNATSPCCALTQLVGRTHRVCTWLTERRKLNIETYLCAIVYKQWTVLNSMNKHRAHKGLFIRDATKRGRLKLTYLFFIGLILWHG